MAYSDGGNSSSVTGTPWNAYGSLTDPEVHVSLLGARCHRVLKAVHCTLLLLQRLLGSYIDMLTVLTLPSPSRGTFTEVMVALTVRTLYTD